MRPGWVQCVVEPHETKAPATLCAILAFVMAVAAGGPIVIRAQESAPVPGGAGAYKLHVYEDLVEVPTLVLSRRFADMPGLQASSFRVRLDGGPEFRPASVRVEGDDALELGVLVDASGALPNALLADVERSLSLLSSASLTSRDRTSLFATDCGLFAIQSGNVPSAVNPLEGSFRAVLANPGLHQQATGATTGCRESRRLWDAIAGAARSMRGQPGRRVLLVLTDGIDRGSVNTWEQVREYANALSVTVFGFRTAASSSQASALRSQPGRAIEDPFGLLCANTGGTVLGIGPNGSLPSLRRAIAMVRNRYVLYFPRPENGSIGRHRIDVAVDDSSAIVRPTGVVFPPKEAQPDPDAIVAPPKANDGPEYGSRKILQPSLGH